MPRSVVDFDIRGGRSKEANLPDQNAQRLEQAAHALTTKSGWGEDPPSNVSISFNNGTRTFTITPSGSTFEYWIQGVKYTKSSAETVIITDTEGLWYIFYSKNTLTASQSIWDNGDGSIAFVATVHWDATNNVAITVGWELHPYDMGVDTHKYLHESLGTQYERGLGLVEGTGGDDGKVAIDGGRIHDESIVIVIIDGGGSGLWEQELGNTSSFAAAQIPVYYRSGATAWRKYSAGDYPFYDNSGGDNVHYNSYSAPNWASSAASSSAKYIAMWIYGFHDISEPVIAIMGQIESNTLNAAKNANTLETIDFGTLPFSEMKILYRVIFKSNGTWAHTEDMRSVNNVPGGTYVPLTHPISDDVFDSTWDGVTTIAPSKNSVYDMVKDEDDMVSDSAVHGATQQSIKAYDDAYRVLQHNREITPFGVSPQDAANGRGGGNCFFWDILIEGIVGFGETSKTGGKQCLVNFKVPSDYVDGTDITLQISWGCENTANPNVTDYNIIAYYARDGAAKVQTNNFNATWSGPDNSFHNNETLTITGTNILSGDIIVLDIKMEDDNNAVKTFMSECTLLIPVNTRT
ncbi:hypothetical protein LCGC14_1634530 [marine sediment metagenome]|uniref:Uncharacterized protein n=1 Tax=marine sediment metagenome TaxID=412755 RepID=A0A0F9I1P8_9ZZZZ